MIIIIQENKHSVEFKYTSEHTSIIYLAPCAILTRDLIWNKISGKDFDIPEVSDFIDSYCTKWSDKDVLDYVINYDGL